MNKRPDYCCGKCPEIETGYDCACNGNPRCEKWLSVVREVAEIAVDAIKRQDLDGMLNNDFGMTFHPHTVLELLNEIDRLHAFLDTPRRSPVDMAAAWRRLWKLGRGND